MIKIALSSWSLHLEFLNPHISEITAERFPAIARGNFGVDCIEFYEGDYAMNFLDDAVDLNYAKKIRKACDDAEVRVVCVAASNDLTNADEEEVRKDLRRLAKWVEHCAILGCPIIRINAGRRKLNDEPDPSVEKIEKIYGRKSRIADGLMHRLKELVFKHRDSPVVFALENHPRALESDDDTNLLLNVIHEAGSDKIKTCPDVGAMAPGYWRRGFELLAPHAAHVHLKPNVFDENGNPERISTYGHVVKELLAMHRFDGAVSFEFTEYRDIKVNPFKATADALQEIFHVFGQPVAPVCAYESGGRSSTGEKLKINDDHEITPAPGILQLLADGCESNLKAEVQIHDFATGHGTQSVGAQHTSQPGENRQITLKNFCGHVTSYPETASVCRAFHEQILDQDRQGIETQPQIRICPMGLMVLTVPVKDEHNFYASISCGAWIEHGTEGTTIESILKLTEPRSEARKQLERSFPDVATFSVDRLQKSRNLLGKLAEDLAGLYKRRLEEKRRLRRGTEIINEVSRLGTKYGPGFVLE